MRVSRVTYAMLRKQSAAYENDRVEITVEVNEGESVAEAVKEAKRACEKALATTDYEGY